MQKKLKPIVLIMLTLGYLELFSSMTFRMESVTYVGSYISSDATWELANSPYVITNDVLVDAGSTLTIEPGVEVRFNGSFTFRVAGSLYAIGNENNPVVFTSNKPEPNHGDWNTIEFTGVASDSLIMKHSVVKYAKSGLTTKSIGRVVIEKCEFMNASESGIHVMGESNIMIRDNAIKTDGHGIYAEGEVSSGIIATGNYVVSSHAHGIYFSSLPPESQIRNVTVSGNTIFSKMDGIRFQAHYTTMYNSRVHSVTISNNTLQCEDNGIYLYVESWYDSYIYDVAITGNIVVLDKLGDGIRLRVDGNWMRYLFNVVVSNNRVSNAMNGIYVSAGEHTHFAKYDATIVGNRVSQSERGVCVLTFTRVQAQELAGINANITANSICYNTLGICFDGYAHNSAHYNHIYRNSHGMTISNGATVNATYNYWGDETGPYHATLNPTGKGNSVNGNGTDLDFRPFLFTPISSLNKLPVAVLETDKKSLTTNQLVKFNATASSDDSHIDEYFFDFGDGTNSSWTPLFVIEHNYTRSGIYNASLIVMDDLGFMSDNTEIQTIEVLSLLEVSLTLDPTTIHSGEEALVKVHVTSETNAVEGALIQMTSDGGGEFTYTSDITDTNGDLSVTFTISNVSVQTNIKIAATASKSGCHDGFVSEYLTVLPLEERWFDKTLIWLFAIAIIISISSIFYWKKMKDRAKP